LLAGAGCSKQPQPPELFVYCGAGIRPPVEEAAEQFCGERGINVQCDYAGSELLLSRIKLSGVGDVYIPGDASYVDQAEEQGLVVRREPLCDFVPVILVQRGNPRNIRAVQDLFQPGVTVGLGDPEACAIGRKATRILRNNGIDQDVENRQVTFRALTVNELGDKVKLGALDAVIVWDATAAYYADSTEVVPIAEAANVISTVTAAVLSSSAQRDLGNGFVDFLVSQQGREIFAKHHYTLSSPPAGDK
jgi:molybdate transport system substrate-binding protein